MAAFLSDILDRNLPEETEAYLRKLLGGTVPLVGDGNRYQIAACGRFRGAITADLLTFAKNNTLDAALVIVEHETERVLYFEGGLIVGAASNVLFERLGRVLYTAEVVSHEDSGTLIDLEERKGETALLSLLPEEAISWAAEKRIWDVGAALYFVTKGHFMFIEGPPELSITAATLDPMAVALEGMRLHDQWRNKSSKDAGPRKKPVGGMQRKPPAPIEGPLQSTEMKQEQVEALFKKIREADIGYR